MIFQTRVVCDVSISCTEMKNLTSPLGRIRYGINFGADVAYFLSLVQRRRKRQQDHVGTIDRDMHVASG